MPVTSETQHALAALHRLRSTGLATRTARINTVRGLLREFGVVIPTGARHVVPALEAVLEDADASMLSLLRPALAEAAREIGEIEGRICTVEGQLDAVAEQTPVVSRLRSIPGVGLLTATALVAAVGDVQRFPPPGRYQQAGRHLPADAPFTGGEPCCGTPSAGRRGRSIGCAPGRWNSNACAVTTRTRRPG